MQRFLWVVYVAASLLIAMYIMRFVGGDEAWRAYTEGDKPYLLTSEGEVKAINRDAGTVTIWSTDWVPDCYPFTNNVKVASAELLQSLKVGDQVQFDFKSTLLPVKRNDGALALSPKEITAFRPIPEEKTSRVYSCPK
jgi:hypothetical protein